MKTIKFETTGSIAKTAKEYHKINDLSRKGIVKAFLNNEISDLNVIELCAIFDNVHEGRADFIPEFFPKTNGHITLEQSKEYWGELWHVVFGEDGEHWGKDLNDAKELGFWKFRKELDEVETEKEDCKVVQTKQEFFDDYIADIGKDEFETMKGTIDNEYYELIIKSMKQGETISQKVYDSLSDMQKYHFNKHYNHRGDKVQN